MKGEVKPIAEAVASGRWPMALTNRVVEASSRKERLICTIGRRAAKMRQPRCGMKAMRTQMRWPVKRAQTISTIG